MRSFWLPITAAPYFFLYGRDLLQAGYKKKDLFRVYALNLMLIPVNLGGVFKSVQQLLTKQKIPFCRTPKVMGRTVAPPFYVFSQYLILLYCASRSFADYRSGYLMHAMFASITAFVFLYIIVNFIGLRESIADIVYLRKQRLSTSEQNEQSVLADHLVQNK